MTNMLAMARHTLSPGRRICFLLQSSALLAVLALVGGCGGGSGTTADPPPEPPNPTPGVMDVTLFVTSDTHFTDAGCPNPARAAIQAMNAHVIGQPNPAEPGYTIQTPTFVLTLGDLCDGGTLDPATDAPSGGRNYTDQWTGFNTYFPLGGVAGDSNRLAFPNRALSGNHDYYRQFGAKGADPSLYVPSAVAQRHAANLNPSTGNVYYSFNVAGVHFALLGCWADNAVCAWLQDDLQAVGPNVPVVLGLHYAFNDGESWWTDAERQRLADAIDGYNVVAIIHGHTHEAQTYRWQGYDCFDVGSTGIQGEFAVMRHTATSLTWAQYRATWDANGNWTGGNWMGTFGKRL